MLVGVSGAVAVVAVVPDVVIPPGGIHFREVMIGHERRYIEAALQAAGGVQKKAAELLHIRATTLNVADFSKIAG